MSEESQVVARRGVLRGGAIAAGVAAGAVIAGSRVTRADAAVGDPVTVGGSFTANNQSTTFTMQNGATTPTMRLINQTGPALRLDPVTDDDPGSLAIGNVAGGVQGPWVGVDDGTGSPFTTYLATGVDIAQLPVPVAFTPVRVLDTRNSDGRLGIIDASPSPFDSAFRLKDGAWIDIAIDTATATDYSVEAAFLNVTITGAQSNGFVTVCPPGPRPVASTINFVKGQSIANGVFVAVGPVGDLFAVRVYARATTHVVLDLSGLSVNGLSGPAAAGPAAVKAKRAAAKSRPSARLVRVRARKR
ncbi:hypothetical protein [Microlunatus ginsengisoli]|uniref:DUF4397 domain-containing protein n=1 Tax=Microlunatus ginsengisoli TaxID=363863 RepID=A0ABP7AFK1_9ACTN